MVWAARIGMDSPTVALLWEIWWRHRVTAVAVVAMTVAGRMLYAAQQARGETEHSALVSLLGMVSFLLLFSIVNYTEYSGSRAVGRFPSRLFTLPVSSLRLVAVPALTGIVSIEVLYLAWREPLSAGGPTGALFIGVLLAAFVVFYQACLWIFERIGVLRLLLVGVIGIGMFAVGLLPSFPPAPPPLWRTEAGLGAIVIVLAVAVFLLAWQQVAALRAGGRDRGVLERLASRVTDVWPVRQREFASGAAAQFWFEWRMSGAVLPALVAGVLLVVIAPMSWLSRGSGTDTMNLLLATLAAPIVLAIPVGIAFSKPTFWSEDLSMPAFVAVRPLSADDFVAIKVKVAAMSVVLSWTVVLAFVAVWLASWAQLDALSRLAIQVWAFHGRSVIAVYGSALLIIVVGMFLTWRFLVCRLWSGSAGRRAVFVASVVPVVLVPIAAMVFDATRLPVWVLDEPERLVPVVWIATAAVIAKYWLAAYAWRRVASRYLRQYLIVSIAGTIGCVALAMVFWNVARIYLAVDGYRFQTLMLCMALLAVPIARVGVAPSCLARNRHRGA